MSSRAGTGVEPETDPVRRSVRSALPGLVWPAVPEVLDARVLAVQYQLRRSQWWSSERLLAQQLRQAAALLAHAARTVPYYRERLPDLGEASGYGEFRTLPILNRAAVQEAGDSLVTRELPPGHGPARWVATTGSTGRPVRAQETLVTRTFLRAMNQRLALWHGLDHAAKLVSVRGDAQNYGGTGLADWGSGYASGPLVFVDVQTPVPALLERLAAEAAPYVAVYPSLARELARAARGRGQRLPGLDCILTFGEVLDPEVREQCTRSFGARIADVYSSIEAGVLAIQCPSGEHYHVASESVLLEVLDDQNRPCAPGQTGRVVVTPLHNFATPLVRYEIGDYARLGPACACGRGLPVLERILGRSRNLLALPGGERRWPFAAAKRFASLDPIRQVQIAQPSLDTIEARLVLARPFAAGEQAAFERALLESLGHPFRVRVRVLDQIPRGPGGKYEDFRCELDAPAAGAAQGAGVAAASESRAAEPPHRLRVDGRWSVWRDVVLRGTGFPVHWLQRLARPELAAAADAATDAQARFDAALAGAKRLCYGRLERATNDTRRDWRRAMRRLRQGASFNAPAGDAEFETALLDLKRERTQLRDAHSRFETAWSESASALHGELHALGSEPRLREAVAWQNRHALSTGIDALLRRPSATHPVSADRNRELLIARYLQRYCAKNDTIGFFGPVGWAAVRSIDGAVRFVPGEPSEVDPTAEFEPWAMEAFAQALSRDAALRPWIAPRPHPALRRESADIVVLLERRLRLAEPERCVLQACDGATPARSIAAGLALAHPEIFSGEAEAIAALERLAAAGLILWNLPLPVTDSMHERLREALLRLPAGAPVQRHVDTLEQLAALKDRACRSLGDADAVGAAIAALEHSFEAGTGLKPSHMPGEIYGGRTLLYLDTRRNASCELDESLIRELGRSLRPVLDAARWCSCQFYEQFLDFMGGVFDACRAAAGSESVPLDTLWFQARKSAAVVDAIIEDVLEQTAERWASLVPLPEGARTVELESASLAQRLEETFGDAAPGWPGARFQSPDVMLCAGSPEAAASGRCRFVLGELHPADRGLLRGLFLRAHPQPGRLLEAAGIDLPEPLLRALVGTESVLFRTRTNPDSPLDYDLECDRLRSALPRERVIASGELLMERGAGGFRLRTFDGKRIFPAHAFFGPQALLLVNRFALFRPAAHLPRVSIDRLVVNRESWRLPLAALGFAAERSAAARFLGARRWARGLDLPRRLFYRVPGEPKPVYLDLESPVYVELLCHLARAARAAGKEAIDVTEMLPEPREAWLTDTSGNRYTSELRLLFVDRSRFEAGAA